MGGNFKRPVHGGGRFDQRMQRQALGVDGQEGFFGPGYVMNRFHLGQHDVGQAMPGAGQDGSQVLRECGVIHGMNAHAHAGFCRRGQGQLANQRGVFGFAASGRAVFAVQRDVKHAGAKFFRHFGLQLQALAHARFHAAVVVAHGQHAPAGLRGQQHAAGMQGKCAQVCHAALSAIENKMETGFWRERGRLQNG